MASVRLIEDTLPGITEFLEVSLWSEENHLSTRTRLQLHKLVTQLRSLRHTTNDYDYLPDLSTSHALSSSFHPIQEISQNPLVGQSISVITERACSPSLLSAYPQDESTPTYLYHSSPNSAIPEGQSSSFRVEGDKHLSNSSDQSSLQQKLQQISTVPQFVLRNVMQNKSRSLPPTTASNVLPQRTSSNSSMPSRLLSHLKARWSIGREVYATEQESLYEEAVCDPNLLASTVRNASTPNKASISSPITNSGGKCNPDDITLPRPLRANAAAPPAHSNNPVVLRGLPGNSSQLNQSAANPSRRRFSCAQILDQTWTLVGPLWHRYKSGVNKWQPLSFCVLAAGGRLLGFRNTGSSNPVLNLFLVGGHRPVYAGKEGEKEHVFKLTHPTFGTCVLAAPTQEQAMGWIEQIALYCVGQIPAQGKSYLNSTVQDNHEDSGFSAPVSSGSSGEAGQYGGGGSSGHENAGNQGNYAVTIPLSISSQSPMPAVTTNTAVGFQSRLRMASMTPSSQESGSGVVMRPSGILNSVRRKVESIGAKKRMRKVMSLQFTPADDCIISGMAKIRITKRGNWCERLCQLRPYTLEAYRMSFNGTSSGTGGASGLNNHSVLISSPFNNSQADLQLDFALSLDNVQLGVCQDKKHSSALKLSCPDASDVMLFEIADKLHMGAWIRGFIQAIGLIPEVSYESINEWLPVGTPLSASRANIPYPPFLMTTRRAPNRNQGAQTYSGSFNFNEQRPTSYFYNEEEPIYDEVCTTQSQSVATSHRRSPKNSPGSSKGLSQMKRGSLPPLPCGLNDQIEENEESSIMEAQSDQVVFSLPRRTSSETDLLDSSVEHSILTEESYEEEEDEEDDSEKIANEEEHTVPELPTPTSGRHISLSTSLQNHSRPMKIALSRHQSLCTSNNPRRVPPHGNVARHRREGDISQNTLNTIITRGCSLADLIAREDEQQQASSSVWRGDSTAFQFDFTRVPSVHHKTSPNEGHQLSANRAEVCFEYDAFGVQTVQEEVIYELPPQDDNDKVETVVNLNNDETEVASTNVVDVPPNSNEIANELSNLIPAADAAFHSQCESTTSSYHSVFSEPSPPLPASSSDPPVLVRSHSRDVITRSASATTTTSSPLLLSSTAPCSPFKHVLVGANTVSSPAQEVFPVSHRASLRCTSHEIGNPQVEALKVQLKELKTLKCKLEKCRCSSSSEFISSEDILLLEMEIRKKDTQLQVLEKECRRRFTIHEANSMNTIPISLSQ